VVTSCLALSMAEYATPLASADSENGDLAEIFLNTWKHGTAVDVNVRDAGIAASLLLQHGCHLHTLRKALTRNSDGSASGPLARALDLLGQP
jgi:hypothetical protein